jgi:uncharacterized protein YpmS
MDGDNPQKNNSWNWLFWLIIAIIILLIIWYIIAVSRDTIDNTTPTATPTLTTTPKITVTPQGATQPVTPSY